jgi:hypothetical protein
VDAAGEGIAAGLAEPVLVAGGDVAGLVELVDLDPGIREAALVVGAHDRSDETVLGVFDLIVGSVAQGSGEDRSRGRATICDACGGLARSPMRSLPFLHPAIELSFVRIAAR